jgi:hypothetical protein
MDHKRNRALVNELSKLRYEQLLKRYIQKDQFNVARISEGTMSPLLTQEEYTNFVGAAVPVFELCDLCVHKETCSIRERLKHHQRQINESVRKSQIDARATFGIYECAHFKMIDPNEALREVGDG